MGIVKSSNQQEVNIGLDIMEGCTQKHIFLKAQKHYRHAKHASFNQLVTEIFFGLEGIGYSGLRPIVYYTNCYHRNFAVMNDSIINLFDSSPEINLYVTNCGAILLWKAHDLLSTIDMQQLNFETPEIMEFLKDYDVVKIYEKKGFDYLLAYNHVTDAMETFKLESKINLASDASVELKLIPMQ
jgi:hypothetical protein